MSKQELQQSETEWLKEKRQTFRGNKQIKYGIELIFKKLRLESSFYKTAVIYMKADGKRK